MLTNHKSDCDDIAFSTVSPALCKFCVTESKNTTPISSKSNDLVLIQAKNVVIERCPTRNIASLMPTADDGEEHNCEEIMTKTASSQTDLKDISLQNPEMIVFVDGSSTKAADGSLLSGYAVCSESDILEKW